MKRDQVRPLVTPGSGETSGLWFSWVRYPVLSGTAVRSLGGSGSARWDVAAQIAVGGANRIRAELDGKVSPWLTR